MLNAQAKEGKKNDTREGSRSRGPAISLYPQLAGHQDRFWLLGWAIATATLPGIHLLLLSGLLGAHEMVGAGV